MKAERRLDLLLWAAGLTATGLLVVGSTSFTVVGSSGTAGSPGTSFRSGFTDCGWLGRPTDESSAATGVTAVTVGV